jgi:hypothetical protein
MGSDWVQRVLGPDGEILSQLCDADGNMTAREFKEAMRKQVATHAHARTYTRRECARDTRTHHMNSAIYHTIQNVIIRICRT